MSSNRESINSTFITSNSQFHYVDKSSQEVDNRIRHNLNKESRFQLRHDIPIRLQKHCAMKNLTGNFTESANERAEKESIHVNQREQVKYDDIKRKDILIEEIVRQRNEMIRERLAKEKSQLQTTLVSVIKDALKFTKENTPMISMMPTKLTNAIKQIREERGLNISSGSLNASMKSSASTRSIHKYESNQFLKALGLDLTNLTPNNIVIDIEKAYEFVKKWKINRNDIKEIIRMKVVNEIMNVEERRSAQRVEKLNKKIQKLKGKNEKIALDKKAVSHGLNRNSRSPLKRRAVVQNAFRAKSPEPIPDKKAEVEPVPQSKSKSKKKAVKPPIKEKKKRIKLNGYRNVEKIVKIISSSEQLCENKNIREHYSNLFYNKFMDDLTKKMLIKNKLTETDGSFLEN